MAEATAPSPSSRHVHGPRVSIDTRTGRVLPTSSTWNFNDTKAAARFALFAVTMGLTVLLGVSVRASHLAHPMRYDESYNYLHYVSHGPTYIVTHYVPNNHILHTLSVWAVGCVAGHSPAALRIPAFVAGVLLIPATAWLAWSFSRRMSVAMLTCLATSCSSALIEYSVNARGYTMLALFSVLAALALLYALRSPQQRWIWAIWGVIGAAGMYTVPIMALPMLGMSVVGAIAVILCADADRKKFLLRGMGRGAMTFILLSGLAYLPVLIVGGLEPFAKSQGMAYEILGRQISSPMQMAFTTLALWARHAPLVLMVIVGMGATVFLIQSLRTRETNRWMLLSVVGLPVLAAVVASAPLPARTWLFALPFLLVMAAQGITEISIDDSSMTRRLCGLGIQVATVLAFLVSLGSAWRSDLLCSEPGGLVLVAPALKECQDFGPSRCALISPYTPATAYYKSRLNAPDLEAPSSPETQRVYILTSNDCDLEVLWRPGVDGYELFDRPQTLWERPGGRLYVAERAERNVLR